jgi:hypothetical protein
MLLYPALASAGATGMADDLPLAPAAVAGSADSEEALGLKDLSLSLTGRTQFRAGPRFQAISLAPAARLQAGDFELEFFSFSRLHERDA